MQGLIYANDAVLISKNGFVFDRVLSAFVEPCGWRNLGVNTTKSRAIVFKSKSEPNFSVKIDEETLEVGMNLYI